MEGVCDLLVLVHVVVELNRARIDIVIFHFPGTQLSLECLELYASETKIFRANDQIGPLEARFRVSMDESHNRNTTDTPLAGGLGALTYGYCHTSKTLLNQNTGGETSGGA